MKRRKKTALGLVALLILLLPLGSALAAGELQLRGAISSGGTSVSSDGLTLRSAVGQPAAGSASGTDGGLTLCSGINCAPAQQTAAPTVSPTVSPTVEPTPGTTPVATPTPDPASGDDASIYLPLMRTE